MINDIRGSPQGVNPISIALRWLMVSSAMRKVQSLSARPDQHHIFKRLDDKPWALSPASSLYWLLWDIKEYRT